jgi:hypothetical protein
VSTRASGCQSKITFLVDNIDHDANGIQVFNDARCVVGVDGREALRIPATQRGRAEERQCRSICRTEYFDLVFMDHQQSVIAGLINTDSGSCRNDPEQKHTLDLGAPRGGQVLPRRPEEPTGRTEHPLISSTFQLFSWLASSLSREVGVVMCERMESGMGQPGRTNREWQK